MEDAPPPSPTTPAESAAGSPVDRRSCNLRRGLTRSRSRSHSSSSSASPSPRSSAVPFSWEQRPGIPKPLSAVLPATADSAVAHPLLPLPPPVRSHSDLIPTPRKKRSAASGRGEAASADPFASALALCAKGALPANDDNVDDELCDVADAAAASSRRSAATVTHRFRILDFYGSCKATCAVVDATVRLPRSACRACMNLYTYYARVDLDHGQCKSSTALTRGATT
ncbi:hypothetical protein ZIOFF_064995 [Zingiber officinale]|uniref:Uncharacterized protein n=1 Tax=Zingiber officinale TaxID=94328 RepID=A0A8J5EWL2_ZINOF|nr:hypothetical protein ZIOFF_064995 [Zingiber officinale]